MESHADPLLLLRAAISSGRSYFSWSRCGPGVSLAAKAGGSDGVRGMVSSFLMFCMCASLIESSKLRSSICRCCCRISCSCIFILFKVSTCLLTTFCWRGVASAVTMSNSLFSSDGVHFALEAVED